MEQLSANFNENVRWFNEVLGVGRSCDLVNRDLVIGGRRARTWVIDGFGGDAILERIGAFWLSISPEAVAGIDRMQAFVDRFVTFFGSRCGNRSGGDHYQRAAGERRCCWWRASRARR